MQVNGSLSLLPEFGRKCQDQDHKLDWYLRTINCKSAPKRELMIPALTERGTSSAAAQPAPAQRARSPPIDLDDAGTADRSAVLPIPEASQDGALDTDGTLSPLPSTQPAGGERHDAQAHVHAALPTEDIGDQYDLESNEGAAEPAQHDASTASLLAAETAAQGASAPAGVGAPDVTAEWQALAQAEPGPGSPDQTQDTDLDDPEGHAGAGAAPAPAAPRREAAACAEALAAIPDGGVQACERGAAAELRSPAGSADAPPAGNPFSSHVAGTSVAGMCKHKRMRGNAAPALDDDAGCSAAARHTSAEAGTEAEASEQPHADAFSGAHRAHEAAAVPTSSAT